MCFGEKKSKISLCAENVTILTQFHATIKREKKRRGFARKGCGAPNGEPAKGGLAVEERFLHGGSAPGARPAGHNGAPPHRQGPRQAAGSPAPQRPAAPRGTGPQAAPRRKSAPQRRPRAPGHSAPGVYAAQAPRSAEFGRRNAARMRAKRRRRQRLVRMAALAVCAIFVVAACGWVVKSGIIMVMNAIETGNFSTIGNVPIKQGNGPPYIIALDAGHGGQDLGAEGIYTEVNVTEATTNALVSLLEQDANYVAVRCRQNGEGMSVAGRAEAANQAGAELFLSIHANFDETGTATGFECFPQTQASETHEQSLRFARLLATQIQQAGATLRGEAGVRYAFYEEDGNGGYTKVIQEESYEFDTDAQTFGVLEKTQCPAVLAEQCFLSNEGDAAAFASEEGCKAVAHAYYKAICEYFGTTPITG